MIEGFSPTSTGPRWGGKYRCNFCKSTGYVSDFWQARPEWWGHRHGLNCKKRPVDKEKTDDRLV